MIRKLTEADLTAVIDIWLETNVKAHSFISEKYWQDNFEMVKSALPQAEVYVYEENEGEIAGFIGLTAHGYGKNKDYSAGPIDYAFVSENVEVDTYKIIRNTVKDMYPSDHYPVVVDVRF